MISRLFMNKCVYLSIFIWLSLGGKIIGKFNFICIFYDENGQLFTEIIL